MEQQAQPICPICHDRIGVYEPIVLAGDHTHAATSLAREPSLRGEARELFHLGCVEEAATRA